MSTPRLSVYDRDFEKYPFLPSTGRAFTVSSNGIQITRECDATALKNFHTDWTWGEGAAASESGNIYIIGGRCSKAKLCTQVLRGTEPKSFTKVRPLPRPRARHAATTLADGGILVVGGVTKGNDDALELASTILRYDPKHDKWEDFCELPKRASKLVAECVGNNVYVIAGDTGPTSEPEVPVFPAVCRDDVQILNLKTVTWSEGEKKPTAETGVTSAVQGNQIYVVSSDLATGVINDAVEIYDTTHNTWKRAAGMPTPRTNVPVGVIDGKLYCVNGLGRGLRALSIVEVYDPKTDRWSTLPWSPPPCHAASFVSIDNKLHVFGGRI